LKPSQEKITQVLLEVCTGNRMAQDTNKVGAEVMATTVEDSEGVDFLCDQEWVEGLNMDHLPEIWDVGDPGWVPATWVCRDTLPLECHSIVVNTLLHTTPWYPLPLGKNLLVQCLLKYMCHRSLLLLVLLPFQITWLQVWFHSFQSLLLQRT